MTRFLIVRLGSLGDIIHGVPAAAALRRAYPTATIDWLVDVRHRELLELVTVVDGRHVVATSDIGSVWRTARTLRAARYNAVFDLQGLLKSAVLARLAGGKRTIGFPAPLLRERAARAFYSETCGESEPHVVLRNLSMMKAVGVRVPDTEFPIADREPAIAAEARRRLGIDERERFAVINPGAAWPNKRWPPVYFAEVARELAALHGLKSLVLWGPGEQLLAETVVSAAGDVAAVSPPTSVGALASLMKRAALAISGDTGPLHIAGAMGTPLVGIFGPTDPGRNGPWAEDDLTVSRYRVCACHYERRCRRESGCLVDITPREVLALVERRLAVAGAHG